MTRALCAVVVCAFVVCGLSVSAHAQGELTGSGLLKNCQKFLRLGEHDMDGSETFGDGMDAGFCGGTGARGGSNRRYMASGSK